MSLFEGRGRMILIVILILAVVAGGVVAFFLYRGWSNERKVSDYKSLLRNNWNELKNKADQTVAALARVGSPAELDSVASAASEMKNAVDNIRRRGGEAKSPSGYRDITDSEKAALETLRGYLEMMANLATGKNANDIRANSPLLDNRARMAHGNVNDFLSKATFLRMSIPIDFFQAGTMLQNAFSGPESNREEIENVYETVNSFMTADIKDKNFDVIWGLTSTNRINQMVTFGATKEKLGQTWPVAWGSTQPREFSVSKNGIKFTDPSNAVVKVVVYMERGDPEMEDIRVVREPGGWRIDSYPFVGWE